MKRIFKYIRAFFILLLLVVLCVSFNRADAESILIEEELNLENAIIIDGIKSGGDAASDDFFAGEIIYHSESDFGKEKEEKPKSKTPVKTASKTPTAPPKPVTVPVKGNFIDELRAEDPRWHLTSYTIKPKDNLWNIARRFEIDHKLILKANDIKNPSYLREGNIISVPNRQGCSHIVKKGDTLISIAKRYKTNTDSIKAANKIKNDTIRIGQELFIPDGRDTLVAKTPIRKVKSAAKTKTVNTAKATPAKPKPAAVEKQKQLAFIWPLRGRITSGFGSRKDPFDGTRKFHTGIDISVNEGTKVKAARKGTVIFSGWKDGYGKTVILRHEDGYITVYAHNSKTIAVTGKSVETGELIALSGQTGAVTGAHLHFEIRKYLTVLDPMRFLR